MEIAPNGSFEPSTTKLFTLAADLRGIATALESRGQVQRQLPKERALMAQRALDGRALRRSHLPPSLFGEPAWDILLDLFVSEERQRRISVSSVIIASGAPPTTAARWLDELARLQLIARRQHPDDRRSIIVELTERGRQAMNSWADDELLRATAVRG